MCILIDHFVGALGISTQVSRLALQLFYGLNLLPSAKFCYSENSYLFIYFEIVPRYVAQVI